MQPLLKNVNPYLVETIEMQGGFIGTYLLPGSKNARDKMTMITISADRIMAIYQDYIAIENFDKAYMFTNDCFQTNILAFKIVKIENPGNIFAQLITSYSYKLFHYSNIINDIIRSNQINNNAINNRIECQQIDINNYCYELRYTEEEMNLFELTLLVNKVLMLHQVQYVSSSDLFEIDKLLAVLPKDQLDKLQKEGTSYFLTHTKPLDDIATPSINEAKKVIAEYISPEERKNISIKCLPNIPSIDFGNIK